MTMIKFRIEAQPRWHSLQLASALLLAFVAWTFSACGGGVDSGGTGATTPNVAVGPVTGFGSIVVAGIHHDEAAAQIVDDDDQPLAADALRLGAMTTVEGSAVVGNGTRLESTAQRVRVVERLVGPVDSVEAGGLGLTLLGQRVAVTSSTVLDARLAGGLAALRAGDVLAVHGQFDVARNRIVATRIEPRPLAAVFVLNAVVSRYERAARRLTIGGLEVDLAGIAESQLPGSLSAGSPARVKLQPLRAGGSWQATALRGTTPMLGERDNVEIEGRVSEFVSPQAFSVDGVPVDARSAAFPAGVAGLALGARVEVEGRASGGTLVARRVKLESDDDIGGRTFEVEGRISALDAATLTFVVRDITVSYAGAPRFEGGTAADLALNRRVSVKGTLSADRARLQAASIHVEL